MLIFGQGPNVQEITGGRSEVDTAFYRPELPPRYTSNMAFWDRDLYPYINAVVGRIRGEKVLVDDAAFIMPTTPEDHLDYAFRPFKDEQWLTTESALKRYFEIHNQEYLARINTILNQERRNNIVNPDNKVVVVIAAANETNLDKTIQAMKDSYNGDFISEVSVVIFHNYRGPKNSVPPEVMKNLEDVKLQENVLAGF